MIRTLTALVVLLCVPTFALAQNSDEFSIRFFGAIDTVPPTTPVIQQVDPISDSQINISWATSTDNFTVFGYVLFRDGVAIATTTNTFFSDTSLNASTTYSYAVTAFDGVPNYATTSAAVSTTTPDVMIIEPVNGGSGATRVPVSLSGAVTIVPGVATATVELSTNRASRIEIRYGLTDAYDTAFVVGNEFKTDHSIWLADLESDTTYFYEVIGYTTSGRQTVLKRGSFQTLDGGPPVSPVNVSNLQLVQEDDDVILTYELPDEFTAGSLVRIVRSQFGFPQSLNDGVVVYEGAAERVVDADVFADSDTAYYSVFVIDPFGLVSSGAVAVVTDSRQLIVSPITQPGISAPAASTEESSPVDQDLDETGQTATSTESGLSDTSENLSESAPEVNGFPVTADFVVEQTDSIQTFSSVGIVLDSARPFTISVASDSVVGDFKTIVATLYDPRESGRTFSFLLRLNSDTSRYEATIAPLMVAGNADLIVEVFDHDARVVSTYSTVATFTASGTASTSLEVWYWRVTSLGWMLLLVVPFCLTFFLWWIFRRRHGDR